MKRYLALASLICATALAQQPSSPPVEAAESERLVRIVQGGELVEIERGAEHSVIEIRSAPAGSVAASLFALRGACAVARARGKHYFASSPVLGRFGAHKITFPLAATEAQLAGATKTVFTLAECQLLQF